MSFHPDAKGTNNPVKGYQDFTDPRIRAVNQQEIYPTKSIDYGQAQLVTFDLAFYPQERGPYNFDARAGSVNAANGKLQNPKNRWGGIMRAIDQTDFETSNVEYIEFWMQDPFLLKPSSTGGQFYINLGNISEDVLRDGRRQFENGLPGADGKAAVDNSSVWGNTPANPIQVTTAFSNDPLDRPFQDVGLDGLGDDAEKAKFNAYLTQIGNIFGVGSPVYQQALADPSSDDFKNYRDASYDAAQANILARYKNINSPQGNSPIADANSTLTTAFTLYPDQEDLNRDNTLNELEEYFQYKINLVPGQFTVGQNYITDKRSFTPNIPNGKPENWYLFRVPVSDGQKIGNIPDFKSIRFIRMFLTGFEDSLVCRFAKFELVRNQWRNFTFKVDTTGNYATVPPNSGTEFNVLAVNIEENSKRTPIPYVTPPGIERQQLLSNNNVNLFQNEQSMSMQICNLQKDDARGVFKTFNLDLRQYGTLSMFIHAEGRGAIDPLQAGSLEAIIRLGNDFVSNYYEIKIPLTKTPYNTSDPAKIWPSENELALSLQRLIQLKIKRNNNSQPNVYYRERDADGKVYAILGNPNLGEVRGMFLGIHNIGQETICTEAWFNELRLSDLNEKGGWAALGRVDMKLADLGTITFSGSYKGIGFGNLDQRVNERAKDNLSQFDVATNLELGKFLPQKSGISIPMYASYSQTLSTPQFDPYDLDIKLKDKLNAAGAKKDSIKSDAVDMTTIRTINFTNVKKNNTTGKKQKPWSVENLDQQATFSYVLPTNKLPLLDWTTMRVGYVAKYGWLASSLDSVARSLGNFLNNSQDKNATAELDFTRLYQKSRFLRALDWDAPKAAPVPAVPAAKNAADSTNKKGKKIKEKKIKDPNALPELNIAVKVLGRLLTSVKRMSIAYNSTGTTNLAGYTDSTKILGLPFYIIAAAGQTESLFKRSQRQSHTNCRWLL
ncbi:hypothetical protein OSTOST_00131 [Ostertagia ostertagi]